MSDLRSVELPVLMDMLSDETLNFTNLLSDGCSEEDYQRMTLTIRAIQTEIEERKNTSVNESASDSAILQPE